MRLKQRYVWILLAVALFGIAIWATPSAAPPPPITTAVHVRPVPDKPTTAERKRMQERRTWSVVPSANVGAAGVGSAAPKATPRDPFVYAIPPRTDTIVGEVATFLDTRLGKVLQACYDVRAVLGATGLRIEDVDRLAIANIGKPDSVFVLSGTIARLAEIGVSARGAPTPYGQFGLIFTPPPPAAPADPAAKPAAAAPTALGKGPGAATALAAIAAPASGFIATWHGQVLLFSTSRTQIERAIDRIEGRIDVPPFVPEDEAYGPVYGEIAAKATAANFPPELRELVSKLESRLRFRASAPDDVLIDVRVDGADAGRAGKLAEEQRAKSRATAAKNGDMAGVRLFDSIKVEPRADGVRVTVVAPFDDFVEILGPCAKQNPLAPPTGKSK